MASEAPNVSFYTDTGSVDASGMSVGDTIQITSQVWIFTEGVFTDLKITFEGQDYLLDLPDGLPSSTAASKDVAHVLVEPDFTAEYGSSYPITLTLTDSDGDTHTISQNAYVRLENLPTEYAIYFAFHNPDWSIVDTTFEIRVTPPFNGTPTTVSENVTLTRSGLWTFEVLSLSEGLELDSGDGTRGVTAPPGAVGSGVSIDWSVHRMDGGAGDGGSPSTSDDYMDLALTMQVPGQPWIWP